MAGAADSAKLAELVEAAKRTDDFVQWHRLLNEAGCPPFPERNAGPKDRLVQAIARGQWLAENGLAECLWQSEYVVCLRPYHEHMRGKIGLGNCGECETGGQVTVFGGRTVCKHTRLECPRQQQ